jgi:hypothetical protein
MEESMKDCPHCSDFAKTAGADRVQVYGIRHFIPRGWLAGATLNGRMTYPEAIEHWHRQCMMAKDMEA